LASGKTIYPQSCITNTRFVKNYQLGEEYIDLIKHSTKFPSLPGELDIATLQFAGDLSAIGIMKARKLREPRRDGEKNNYFNLSN
jgi:hypothetical protein